MSTCARTHTKLTTQPGGYSKQLLARPQTQRPKVISLYGGRPNDPFGFEIKIPNCSHSIFFLFNSQIPKVGMPPRMPTSILTWAKKVSLITYSYPFLPSIPRNNYSHHNREVTLLTHHPFSLPAKTSKRPKVKCGQATFWSLRSPRSELQKHSFRSLIPSLRRGLTRHPIRTDGALSLPASTWGGPNRANESLQGYESDSWLDQSQLDIPKAFLKGTTSQQGITFDP